MKYDVIVIGSGSAGLNVAMFMNRIGLKVLMIEKGLVGGDCLNYGCVPSKSLISLSKIAHTVEKAKKMGFKVSGKTDLRVVARTIEHRQNIIRDHENPDYFRKLGIDVEIGSGVFVGKNSIRINGKVHSARKIALATGSRPFVPPIPGINRVKYLTNEKIFANKKLPKKFLVVGGGPIGIEIGQAYSRLGAKVTVVERGNQFLPKEEREIADELKKILVEEGIEFKMGCSPSRFEGTNTLVFRGWNREEKKEEGPEVKIKFDQLLIATGRRLNIEGLDLEKAGIRVEKGKLVLDKYLRTTNKQVYAIGDVAGDFMFTHWAEYQASVAIKNMLSPFKKSPDRKKVAWVTFTDPEVATFGVLEEDLKGTYDIINYDVGEVDRAITEGDQKGLLKLYVQNGKIIRGTMIAKNAGEISGELIQAMTQGTPVEKLFNRIFPYPTMGRLTRKAVGKYLGRKLTSRASRLLRTLYKIL
tara:strand:- start:4984 stop:6396 length:1413 start_codon:yes stop_codon:yes gene_type:complete